jgi:hypothetical protein
MRRTLPEPTQPEDSASAVSINTQINTRAKSIRRARSRGAEAARSATSRSEAETASRQAAPRGERSEATSLAFRGERWTPDGREDVTEPTKRSEIASRRLPEGRGSRNAGPEATRGAAATRSGSGPKRSGKHPGRSPDTRPASSATRGCGGESGVVRRRFKSTDSLQLQAHWLTSRQTSN